MVMRKMPKAIKGFLELTHSRQQIEIIEYITNKMLDTNELVDLRARVVNSYLLHRNERSIYHSLETLAKKKEILRVRFVDRSKKESEIDYHYYIGLIDYAKIVENFRKKYPFIPLEERLINQFEELQNTVKSIFASSKILKLAKEYYENEE